jgi:hypothetical protein
MIELSACPSFDQQRDEVPNWAVVKRALALSIPDDTLSAGMSA